MPTRRTPKPGMQCRPVASTIADRLEREVYDIAEKVLAKRPGDMRSMKNRALAANLLGEIASTRHDDAAAAQYADRAVQAGEDVVRFNPSDLGTWQYWIMGRGQVAERMFERGEIGARHRRRPARRLRSATTSGCRPHCSRSWRTPGSALAWVEAASGRRADAERTFAGGVKASEEAAKQFAEGNSMRVLSLARVPVRRARFELVLGDNAGRVQSGNRSRGLPRKAGDRSQGPVRQAGPQQRVAARAWAQSASLHCGWGATRTPKRRQEGAWHCR